jgi:hypothetical protein
VAHPGNILIVGARNDSHSAVPVHVWLASAAITWQRNTAQGSGVSAVPTESLQRLHLLRVSQSWEVFANRFLSTSDGRIGGGLTGAHNPIA